MCLGDIEFIKANLKADAINKLYLDGTSLLYVATINLHYEIVDLLLKKGINPNIKNESGNTVLIETWYWNSPDNTMIDYLLKSGVNWDIHAAAAIGNLKFVKSYFEKDSINLNPQEGLNRAPLTLSSFYGHVDIVKYLVELGADPNFRIERGNGETKVCRYPIHAAAAGVKPSNVFIILKLLFDAGAEVDATQSSGHTALHEVVSRGLLDSAKLLIEYGVSKSVRNKSGESPLDIAQNHDREEIVALLKNTHLGLQS